MQLDDNALSVWVEMTQLNDKCIYLRKFEIQSQNETRTIGSVAEVILDESYINICNDANHPN